MTVNEHQTTSKQEDRITYIVICLAVIDLLVYGCYCQANLTWPNPRPDVAPELARYPQFHPGTAGKKCQLERVLKDVVGIFMRS